MDSGSDDREDDRMEDEHYQSDSEWTTESDSSNEDGVIEHVFNKFKTKTHHEVVLDYLNEKAA